MNPESGPSQHVPEEEKVISIGNAELANEKSGTLLDTLRNARETNPRQTYELFTEFFNSLPKESQNELRETRLFHLLAGSSVPREAWEDMPDDVLDSTLTNFINDKIAPLAEQEKN